MTHQANQILNYCIKNNAYFKNLNAFVTSCYLKNLDFKTKNAQLLWHPSCFIPYQYWYHHVLSLIQEQSNTKIELTKEIVHTISSYSVLLQALGTWRYSAGIYRFDPDVFNYIINSETELIMSDILMNLPEWSLFIETPGLSFEGESIHGFFAYFDDMDEKLFLKITLLLNPPDNDTEALPSLKYLIIDLSFQTLDESLSEITKTRLYTLKTLNGSDNPFDIDRMVEKAEEEKQILKKLLALLLYLCVKEPEITDTKSELTPQKSRPSKKKGALYFFPVNTKIWHVGSSTGSKIREHKTNREYFKRKGITMPHIRRAHFHLYWQGSKKNDNQIPVLKWLLPIPVGMNTLTPDHK